MHEIAFIELLNMIQADASIDEADKKKFERAIHQVGRQHGAKTLVRHQRRDEARKLLDQRVERTVICTRLRAAFDISERQAYRDIESALHLCQNRPLNGRELNETNTNEEVIG